MRFCELTEDEFRVFSSNHPLTSFLQTPEAAKVKEGKNWKYYYVGVKDGDAILCATLLLEYSGKLFKSFSSPRGYLIDFENKKLLQFFTKELKKFVKNKKGIVLNIEPKILYKQRDCDGKIVENGFDNSKIFNNLIKLGYKHSGFYLEPNLQKQIRWGYALDLKNKTEEQIFNDFKATTRNIIRKNIKYGITIRELNYEELNRFKELVDDSANIKNIACPPLSHYQKMYSNFKPLNQIVFLVAELDISNYISILKEEIKEYDEKKRKLANDSTSKMKEYETQIENLNLKINEVEEEKTEKLMLAGGMFMEYGLETIYAFSGMLNKYKNIQAQYLVQWEIIKRSINRKCKIYNFYGITGDLNPRSSQYGVYKFKKGFSGNVIEYLGDFDLIVSPCKYYFLKILKRIWR